MKTILIVEDDLAIARGLADNLKQEGYRVLHEKDGMKGYERAKLEQPDLLILDVMLPTMDGFQICSLLKGENFPAPIFMLTGLTQERSRLEGLWKGADDYIAKPFHLQELLLRIRNTLQRRETVGARAKLLEEEFLKARRIQMASLPRRQPRVKGLDVFGKTFPAEQVGGDYYDYLRLPGKKFGVVVADVSGKGLPAAMYVQKIQGIVQSNAETAPGPVQILRALQEHMSDAMESSSFVTAVVAVFDAIAGSAEIAQAGHLPVLHIRNGKTRTLKPPGIWIGRTSAGMFDKTLGMQTIALRKGDVILFYSDGLIEAKNASGKEFGLRRLRAFVATKQRSSRKLVESCFKAVKQFSGSRVQVDDSTLVAVKVTAHRLNIRETIS